MRAPEIVHRAEAARGCHYCDWQEAYYADVKRGMSSDTRMACCGPVANVDDAAASYKRAA